MKDLEKLSLADLKPDKKNARKHNARNIGMLEQSLKEVGAARSIVIDENNVILAGNGTVEAAGNAGLEGVCVVEASGHEIVAVRRVGLTEKQKTRLKLYDNRVAELAEWDPVQLSLTDDEDWAGVFDQGEMEKILQEYNVETISAPELSGEDRAPIQQMTFTLHDGQAETVRAAMKAADEMGEYAGTGNENSNGNALARVCEVFLGSR